MSETEISTRRALLETTIERIKRAISEGDLVEIVRPVARSIPKADGITIVKRIGEETDYLAEDAIGPLWVGLQFPIDKCLAGRAMTEEQTVIVPDIEQTENIPLNVYLGTFIRSLVAVPIGEGRPTHAICAYWQHPGPIAPDTVDLMETLAKEMGDALMRMGSGDADHAQARQQSG